MIDEILLANPDYTSNSARHLESDTRKKEFINKITSALKPLEKRIVERLLNETQLYERVEEGIEEFLDDEGGSTLGIYTSQSTHFRDQELETIKMKYKYDIDKLLMGSKLGSILHTVLHVVLGEDAVRRILLEEGGSCLEASIAASFLMQVNDDIDAKILGWDSGASDLLRRAYRALLHEHYCVVYTADNGNTMIMLHDGLTFSLELCRQCVSANGEDQDVLLRKLLRAKENEPLTEDARAEVRRLKRILAAYENAMRNK